jgi:hypothetical protein
LDEFSANYQQYLAGSYDCIDRIVLNGYFTMGHNPGGFRLWWQRMFGSEETLDDNHLMRLAGRFYRRLAAYCKSNKIPIARCEPGDRKHDIAEGLLESNPDTNGLFMVMIARAKAPVWHIQRSANGVTGILHPKKFPLVNHYHFHINDPDWGHVTIRICGHPPFPAMIILNGHEYVACQLKKDNQLFGKEGNCFTQIQDASRLAHVADTLCQPDAIGRLSQVCNRWIYSACICFALSSEEQERCGFRYEISIHQVEFSRNLLFQNGSHMEALFETVIDRTRSSIDVGQVRTILGINRIPRGVTKRKTPLDIDIVVETPKFNMSVFRLHFGALMFKAYTKGEHVLRFEATIRNTRELKCGRVLAKFPEIMNGLKSRLERFMNVVQAVQAPYISDDMWETLPAPAQVGASRVGGIDIQKPRMCAVLLAVMALASKPGGFTASDLAARVHSQTGQTVEQYGPAKAAYDIRKLRGKCMVDKVRKSHHYTLTRTSLRAVAALVVLKEKVLKPLLAGMASDIKTDIARITSVTDQSYDAIRRNMATLIEEIGIAA